MDDPNLRTSRPAAPDGAVRRLGHALLQARLFGGPLPMLGRFEVRRKLGEGGMGAVFEAVDPDLGRTVALKVLRSPQQPEGAPDLEHEARMLARLSHPHVVTVYELGQADGERYVCMAHVDGPHLGAWLAARPDLGWVARVRPLLAAARGLEAAHRAGIVHRDFKLENVLVGADGVARVTDFGLARVDVEAPGDRLGPPGMPTTPGTASNLTGTPGYIAPELLAGARADERSDQYAFFVAMRRALAPVRGAEPAALARLMHAGLSADPAARLPDMATVIAQLEALVERPPSPDQHARDVLIERVQRLWIDPRRATAVQVAGAELPLQTEPAPELLGGSAAPLSLDQGTAADLAGALHGLRAGVVLVGAAGAGKTLRLLLVADALLERARVNPAATLPVVLNLTSFSSFGGTLREWLVHEMVAKYALSRDQALRWMADGQLALLLDGLDEVDGPARAGLVTALEALRTEQPAPYLLTCREDNYRELSAGLAPDAVLRLRPLAPDLVPGVLPAGPVHDAAAGDPALMSQLANPLLLSLFVRLGRELADQRGDPTRLRDGLYAATLHHALERPPRLQGADRARAEAGLRWLAAAMSRAKVTELWLEELQASWLPRPSTRALAIALAVIPAYLASLALNLAAAWVSGQPWTSGVFFGLLAVTAAFVIQGGARVTPMEAMRWSWPRVRAWFPRLLVLGVVTGALHGLFFDFWADLMLGVATGVLGLSVIGLEPAGRERRVNPGDGLLESLRNAALVAPVIGIVIGAPVGYLVLPLARPLAAATSMYHLHPDPERAWAVTMGTSAAVTSFFITGGLAPLMHAAIRVAIAWTSPLPLRLRPWLDEMVRRDLMHRVGGGWAFRHATLRAWLAGRE